MSNEEKIKLKELILGENQKYFDEVPEKEVDKMSEEDKKRILLNMFENHKDICSRIRSDTFVYNGPIFVKKQELIEENDVGEPSGLVSKWEVR